MLLPTSINFVKSSCKFIMPGLVDNGMARSLMNIYECLLQEFTNMEEFKTLKPEQIVKNYIFFSL